MRLDSAGIESARRQEMLVGEAPANKRIAARALIVVGLTADNVAENHAGFQQDVSSASQLKN